jgi:hypothetical protein
MKKAVFLMPMCLMFSFHSYWGFYAHQQINRLAIFTLPAEMSGFYKHNIAYIVETSTRPDKRRFSVVEEGARHYIDLDHYGDSAVYKMPRFWSEAIKSYSEDTLKAYGILPWHVYTMYTQLKNAFLRRDPTKILSLSAELGHYIADANVPLHTTENYNGQQTGQEGIHAFWESRLPELYAEHYDFLVGKATYLTNPQLAIWSCIETSHKAVDSVLLQERLLAKRLGERKYSFETKGTQTLKVYSHEYAHAYHQILDGMVERQMRRAIKFVGDIWFTAWVDAGQPDLKSLIHHAPSMEELKQWKEEAEKFKLKAVKAREHE